MATAPCELRSQNSKKNCWARFKPTAKTNSHISDYLRLSVTNSDPKYISEVFKDTYKGDYKIWYDRYCVPICCGSDQTLHSCLNTFVLSKLQCIRVSHTTKAFLCSTWTLTARVLQLWMLLKLQLLETVLQKPNLSVIKYKAYINLLK